MNYLEQIDTMELYPEGRDLFYEGQDPEGFRAEVRATFGFDPAEPQPGETLSWGKWLNPPDGCRFQSFPFFCPPEHIDAVYMSGRWAVGS